MARCLVVGGAGFIGSHVGERLLEDGHEVTTFDNFSTGRRENLKDSYRLFDRNVRYINPTDLAGIDWVFHLAARSDIIASVKVPDVFHDNNVNGTLRLLEACRMAGTVKRFIYASSASVYGIARETPTPETAPFAPRYPYAFTKMIAEQYVMHWSQVYGIPAIALRLFNVYGPRARRDSAYGAVMGVFLAQLANKKPLTIVGDGSQSRDFVYVQDVADAFVKAAESNRTCQVYNVGTGKPVAVSYLAEMLNQSGCEYEYLPWRDGEPMITCANIDKIRADLGWEPRTPINIGVYSVLKELDKWRTAPVWTPKTIAEATAEWHKHLGARKW